MKKLMETLAAFVMAVVLMGSVVGCGQTAPDQGEVDTSVDNTDADDAANEDDANAGKGEEKGGGDGGGGDDPDGGGGDGGDTPSP